MSTLRVVIPGIPQQQGSKRHVGRGVMIETNKNLKSWRIDAIAAIQQAMRDQDWDMATGAVTVTADFWFPRPKSHYGTGKNADRLKDSAPRHKTSAPDLDKLQRALGDALTQSGAIRDDSLIVAWIAGKPYAVRAPHTSLEVMVWP